MLKRVVLVHSIAALTTLTAIMVSSHAAAQQPPAKAQRVPPVAATKSSRASSTAIKSAADEARYIEQLKQKFQTGTSFAVFQPNDDKLWSKVRQTLDAALYSDWQNGIILGQKPQQAYFVKCDRTTMTQNDLDNGRMIALVGVATRRPSEFTIFKVIQQTGKKKP